MHLPFFLKTTTYMIFMCLFIDSFSLFHVPWSPHIGRGKVPEKSSQFPVFDPDVQLTQPKVSVHPRTNTTVRHQRTRLS